MPLVRKVIKVGLTSFGVILPKSWLKYYGYPKEVEMMVQNSNIIITPMKKKVKQT